MKHPKLITEDGVLGSKYGDNTFISIDSMQEQVDTMYNEGEREEWNGCMRTGKCCTFFQVCQVGPKYFNGINKDQQDLWKAHYNTDTIDDLPKLDVTLSHVCSQLEARKNKGRVETRCKIYHNRPKICQEFTCGASKVREQLMRKKLGLKHQLGEENGKSTIQETEEETSEG